MNTGAAMAAVAADGTLVYVPGTPEDFRVLVHVDARGEAQPLGVPAAGYQALRVSPNGMFAAAEAADEDPRLTDRIAQGPMPLAASGVPTDHPVASRAPLGAS